jgi:hypothetical protein
MDWHQVCRQYFDDALGKGFPVFLGHESSSTPLNASPYVAYADHFLESAERLPGRRELVSNLRACLRKADEAGAKIEAILIGGSFTDLRNASPHDIDSLWLYRTDEAGSMIAERLQSLQHQFKRDHIDARFVPADGEVSILVKAVSFFTLLYSKVKGQMSFERGLILLNCSQRESSRCIPTSIV